MMPKHRSVRSLRRSALPVAWAVVWLNGGALAGAQEPVEPRKQARAVRVEEGSIRVDGRLDDLGWRLAVPLTDFVQSEPVEGADPTNRMEVRFVYDDDALYIGARMFSDSPGAIQAPLGRRDDDGQVEYVQVELDTYLDRRTAYMFGVTAAGVRLDHYHASDNEGGADSGFNPVWEGRARIDAEGWTAELWLPFSQLRFNSREDQVWGLNIKRWVPSLNEQVYWVPVLRTERGWASRFGELRGVAGVRPRTRLEVLPYVAALSRANGSRDPDNPFEQSVDIVRRTGADLKVGLGPNLTLEATFNPDFGQIDADPAEVNLSAAETFFSERRPFFLEGVDLLQGETNNFFYSRRVGSQPVGSASGDYVDYPDTTTILGAAKLTGRLGGRTSLGALGAVTGNEFAETYTDSVFAETRVAPRTFWGATRLQRELGTQGSTAGFGMTAVHREIAPGDPLGSRLVRNAFTGVADTRFRFANRTYEGSFSAGFTHIQGDQAAIERVQRSNAHLFQRPDRPDVLLDPTRESLGGVQIRTSFDKIAGTHWLWGGSYQTESPEFESNDFGRLNFAGDMLWNSNIHYRETEPGRYLRSYSFELAANATSFYQTELTPRIGLTGRTDLTFQNFWTLGYSLRRDFRGQNVQLTRGGPSMGTNEGWNTSVTLRNGRSSQTLWTLGWNTNWDENGDYSWSPNLSLSMRPSPSLELTVTPDYTRQRSSRQYVTTLSGGREDVYGSRYIFGLIDRSTFLMRLRGNYVFKPDLTLDIYAEPFASSGRYSGFGELEAARSRHLRVYGTQGIELQRQVDGSHAVNDNGATFTLSNRDFNVRSFRSNVVLRWEWRPGSTLFLVWQQNRSDTRTVGTLVGPGDLFGAFSATGDNIVALKTTLWLSR
jgi:hypothetical protein